MKKDVGVRRKLSWIKSKNYFKAMIRNVDLILLLWHPSWSRSLSFLIWSSIWSLKISDSLISVVPIFMKSHQKVKRSSKKLMMTSLFMFLQKRTALIKGSKLSSINMLLYQASFMSNGSIPYSILLHWQNTELKKTISSSLVRKPTVQQLFRLMI